MKAPRLTNLYDQLSVWERISLRFSADARKDEAEHQRLGDTSPVWSWRLPDHLMAEHSLHVLALTYVGEQLDAAANYFFAMYQLKTDSKSWRADWQFAAESTAYFFTVNTEAWRRFCAGLGIDANYLTASNHRGSFLHYCEEHMPGNAPSAEELQDLWRQRGQDVPALVTADSLLAHWQKAFRSMNSHAPPSLCKGEP